ncbi:MAG TPA: NnrU family protein, partial [Burkholderiales bacterium]|nr:NnrU family protein [Burkholderiales bacterium]
MTALVAATAAFVLAHLASGTPLRGKLIAALGEWPYRGLYSALALVTLAAMIWAYLRAPRELLWPGWRELPLVVMPFALILVVTGYRRNPTMVGADALLKSE